MGRELLSRAVIPADSRRVEKELRRLSPQHAGMIATLRAARNNDSAAQAVLKKFPDPDSYLREITGLSVSIPNPSRK